MNLNDFVIQERMRLFQEGNRAKVHFLDVSRKKWEELNGNKDPDFIREGKSLSKKALSFLQVDEIVKCNGIYLLVRIVKDDNIESHIPQ